MINKRIKIRGAIGIKKGLGLDEIEIDFTGKTGLVALSGPNGKGKTTVLELMSVFRTLASRKGSLKNHFGLRDSYIEQDFIYNGDDYQIIWKIDSGSDRQEAFVIVNGESIINGKVTEYDRYIIENFGSQNLFYNSVFCAQGSGNMSDMTTGKIKELFVEFLRIERLADYETTCKDRIKEHVREKDILDSDIVRLIESSIDIGQVDIDIKHARGAISDKRLLSTDISSKISTASATQNKMIEKKAKESGIIDQVFSLEKQLIPLISGRDQMIAEVKTLDSILVLSDSILAAKKNIDTELEQERYFSHCMSCAVDEQGTINAEMGRLRDEVIAPITLDIKALNADANLGRLVLEKEKVDGDLIFLESKKGVLLKSLEDVGENFELVKLGHQIEAAKKEITMAIDPACTSTICPALVSIEHSKKALPGLEKERLVILAGIEIKKDELNAERAVIEARIVVGKDQEFHLNNEIENAKKENTLTLDIFGKRIAAAEKELAEASALWIQSNEIMAFYRDAAEDSRVKSSSFSDLAGRSGEIELAINRKSDLGLRFGEAAKNILSVENEIESMRAGLNPLLDRIIIDGQKEIDALNKSKDDIEWDINFLDKKLAVLSENLIRLEKDKDRLEEHQTQIKAVKKEIEEWSYLRDACGKNGLQALEIDGAAPLITTEANTILADAFGLDNQIKIVTQDPETGREVFWIKVIREDGSEDDFGNLSGGQRVWIAHALSLGMTLVSKRKSGRDFRTLFMDECDGALDEKKAVDFIKLYRAMLKTGDFDTCIFISHKPELISMADHVIDFGKMGD